MKTTPLTVEDLRLLAGTPTGRREVERLISAAGLTIGEEIVLRPRAGLPAPPSTPVCRP